MALNIKAVERCVQLGIRSEELCQNKPGVFEEVNCFRIEREQLPSFKPNVRIA